MYYVWRFLSRLIYPFLFSIKVHGMENVPRTGAFIFAANHVSNVDPFVMGIISPRKIHFVAKESLFKNPIFGWVIRGCGAFPIRRGAADHRSVKEALSYLKIGDGLMVFPEGTRHQKEGMQRRINPGIGLLAAKAGAPIVPVFVHGSLDVLPPGAKWFRHRPVNIYIGQPLQMPAQLKPRDVAEQTMQAVYQLAPPQT